MILKWIKKMCSSAQEKIFDLNTEYLSESCMDCPNLSKEDKI